MTKYDIATTTLFTLLAAASGCASSVTSPSMRSTGAKNASFRRCEVLAR